MTARELGTVGIKLIGLTAIVQAIQMGPTLFGFMMSSSGDEGARERWSLLNYLPGLILILALAAVGVSIIAYAGAIGRRLFPQGKTLAISVSAEELRVILFAAVGALIVIDAVPAVLRDVAALAAMARQGVEPVGGGLRGENGLELGEAVLRAALGIFLWLGGRNLAGLVGRLRRLGSGEGGG